MNEVFSIAQDVPLYQCIEKDNLQVNKMIQSTFCVEKKIHNKMASTVIYGAQCSIAHVLYFMKINALQYQRIGHIENNYIRLLPHQYCGYEIPSAVCLRAEGTSQLMSRATSNTITQAFITRLFITYSCKTQLRLDTLSLLI